MKKISVMKPVLVSNQERARLNRRFFDRAPSLVINIIAAPGAGKTSVIEQLARRLQPRYRVLVIEGDIRGTIDRDRLRRAGIDALQINTKTACHLDAFMVARVLPRIRKRYDLVLVENVGNLVCPAEFEIGEDFKLAILSTAEGDDKPLKYPLLFNLARVVVINKRDLLPHVDFDPRRGRAAIRRINPRAAVFEVSARTGEGFSPLVESLLKALRRIRR
jgi:hydrogenase nickel incorporation protein HypB